MSGSLAAVRAAVCRAEREEWSRGESNVAELRIFRRLTQNRATNNEEHLASWVRRSARACVRWPRSHVSELREAKPFPSLLKLDSHKIDNNF